MVIFIVNFLLIPLYGKLIKNKKNLVTLICVQLFLILALRSENMGVDIPVYHEFYDHYRSVSLSEILSSLKLFGTVDLSWGAHESGYTLFAWIISNVGFSFHSFLVIHSAICVFSMGVFIYRYSYNPTQSFILFIGLGGFGYFFDILRQSLGLAVLLFSIPYLKNRKMVKYFITVLIASLFHSILLLAVIIYPLSSIKISKNITLLVVATSFSIVGLFPILYNYALYPIFVSLNRPYEINGFTWNNMFLLIFAMVLFLYFFPKNSNAFDNAILSGSLLALPIQTVAFYVPIVSRAAIGLFLPFMYISLANSFEGVKSYYKPIIRVILYVVLCTFYIYTLIGSIFSDYEFVFRS